jgi:hypothetical protein
VSPGNIECTNIYGNPGGDWDGFPPGTDTLFGNLSADPMFCDTSSLDLHLVPGSPCVDAPECGQVGAFGIGCLGPEFIRGDDDCDGEISISDPILSLCAQFADCELSCLDASDVDDDGEITISDAIYNLAAQFGDGPEPSAPFPACGPDPTEDEIICACHTHCMGCPGLTAGLPRAMPMVLGHALEEAGKTDQLGAGLISDISLSARPNPARSSALIRYALPHRGPVELVIYGVSGQEVKTLVDGHVQPGVHSVPWNGRNDSGRSLPEGVYFVRLEAGCQVLTRKLVLIR